MIALKIGKAICPACGKVTTLGLFSVENKDWTKAEIG